MTLSLKTLNRGIYGAIFLCFVALGALAIGKLAVVSEKSSIIDKVWVPRSRTAEELALAARDYRISEALRILSASPEMAAQADGDLKDNADVFAAKLADYRKLLLVGESPEPIEKVQTLWQEYIAGNAQMLAFANEGKQAEATGRFRNSASKFYLVADALGKVVAADTERGSADSATADRIYKQARFQIIATLAFITLLIGAAVVFFEFRVWRILIHLSRAMNRLANNEFDTDVRWAARGDEIGEMARAVQVFKENGIEKQRLEAETDAQRTAAEETDRENAEMLASVDRQRNAAVSSIGRGLEELSKGNMTFRLTEDFAAEFQKLQNDFNAMAEAIAALVGEVQKTGMQVTASVTEITASAKQHQATANEIASTTTEVGATSREISATSRDLLKTMNELAAVAENTSTSANSGQTSLTRMEGTMHHVMEAAGSINAKLSILNEKAGNINQVVITITKVADQTNLLSLNAAIEAEKAGEYGRGFSVVAAEIRRLADQTSIATYDIEQIVKEIQSAISAGVMGMDKFSEDVRRSMLDVQQTSEQLSQIIQQVQALVPRFEAVNDGMQAQATGAEQISEALVQLTDAARETVKTLTESNLSIDELSRVSGNLRNNVSRFKLQA